MVNAFLMIVFLATGDPTGIRVEGFSGPSSCRFRAETITFGNQKDEAVSVACINAATGEVIYFKAQQ